MGLSMDDLAGLGDSIRVGPQWIPAASHGLPVIQRGPHNMPLSPPLEASSGKLRWWKEGSYKGAWVPRQSVTGVLGLGAADWNSPEAVAGFRSLNRATRDALVANMPAKRLWDQTQVAFYGLHPERQGEVADDLDLTRRAVGGDEDALAAIGAGRALARTAAYNARPESVWASGATTFVEEARKDLTRSGGEAKDWFSGWGSSAKLAAGVALAGATLFYLGPLLRAGGKIAGRLANPARKRRRRRRG